MSRYTSLSIYDRRRLLIAGLLTMVALPALWWAKRDNPIAAPSVAAADIGGALANATGASKSAALVAGPGTPPGYLSGPGEASPPVAGEATGPPLEESFTRGGLGSFKTFPPLSEQLCEVSFLPDRTRITVENTDNGEKVECLVIRTRMSDGILIVLDSSLFVELSDLAEAPVPVRIRW